LGTTGFDGKQAIALSAQAPEVIHAVPECVDKSETVYTLSISDSGKTRIGVTRHYYGDYYGGKNRYFSELPPEERRRYFQEIVSGVAQGARPIGDLKTDFSAYPGLEQFTVDVDNYSVVDGKYLYFDLPFTPSLFPPARTGAHCLCISRKRTGTPFAPKSSCRRVFAMRSLRRKAGILMCRMAAGRPGSYRSETPGKCVLVHEFDTTPTIIEPRDYSAMLKVESTLERKSSKVFLFSSAQP
jgi:hypothetical protein